jgi:periplasmic copper chaperone A
MLGRASGLTACKPVISPRRLMISAATAAGALVLLATPAFAHVEVEPTQVEPGSTSPVLFTIEHGCSESPTTKVEMQIPVGVTGVQPELVPGWEFAVTGRVILWTGGPQPDDEPLVLSVIMTFPDTPDQVLLFPVVQTCQIGEIRWIQPPNPDGSEPEDPAPVVVVAELPDQVTTTTTAAATTAAAGTTAAAATTAAAGTTAVAPDSTAVTTSASTDDAEDDDSTPLVIGAVAVGILALVGVGIWFGVRKMNA